MRAWQAKRWTARWGSRGKASTSTDGTWVYFNSTFSSFKAPHYASHRLQLRWGTQDAPHNACCILSALSKLVTVFQPSASLRQPRDNGRQMTPRKCNSSRIAALVRLRELEAYRRQFCRSCFSTSCSCCCAACWGGEQAAFRRS